MSRLMRGVAVASALAAAVLVAVVLSMPAVPRTMVSAGTATAPKHAGKLAAAVVKPGLLDVSHVIAAGSGALVANKVKYPCTSATPYGSVLVKPYQWATGLVNTGHDGANFNVYSNYASGSCDRSIASTDGSDPWGGSAAIR